MVLLVFIDLSMLLLGWMFSLVVGLECFVIELVLLLFLYILIEFWFVVKMMCDLVYSVFVMGFLIGI